MAFISGIQVEDINKQPIQALKGNGVDTPFVATNTQQVIADATRALITCVGDDPDREGLHDTPARVGRAWGTWCGGYGRDPEDVIKTFTEQAYNEMIVLKDIPIYSTCEHHLAAIFGSATIAYIPNGRVLGLSKLSRVADIFARRLQVQERLTVEIADALAHGSLKPKGVGVILKCRHLCMESRGIQKQGSVTVTSALRGVMANGEPRAEFLKLAGD